MNLRYPVMLAVLGTFLFSGSLVNRDSETDTFERINKEIIMPDIRKKAVNKDFEYNMKRDEIIEEIWYNLYDGITEIKRQYPERREDIIKGAERDMLNAEHCGNPRIKSLLKSFEYYKKFLTGYCEELNSDYFLDFSRRFLLNAISNADSSELETMRELAEEFGYILPVAKE